ncbi:MAG: tetratricopeptide repeat protein [Prevotellaceae bacterium]|jgi:tetratricopeptide (TPR) repeat protein|nr:tetratricopeptide repeat protein [Prevotellaceae bacterium]
MKEKIQRLIDDASHDEALNILNKQIEDNPQDDEAYYLRGGLYKQLGKWGESLSDLNKAIAINPESPAVTLRTMLQEIIDFRYTDLLNP